MIKTLHKPMRKRRVHGITLVELLVIVSVIGLLTTIMLPMLTVAHEGARRVSCASNLRQLGLSLKMYAAENRGEFPPIAECVGDDCLEPDRDVLMFAGNAVFPEYAPDAEVLICPSDVGGIAEYEAGEWRRPDPWSGQRG